MVRFIGCCSIVGFLLFCCLLLSSFYLCNHVVYYWYWNVFEHFRCCIVSQVVSSQWLAAKECVLIIIHLNVGFVFDAQRLFYIVFIHIVHSLCFNLLTDEWKDSGKFSTTPLEHRNIHKCVFMTWFLIQNNMDYISYASLISSRVWNHFRQY